MTRTTEPVADDAIVADLLRRQPKMEDITSSVIVVDGLPIVDTAKLPKLLSVLKSKNFASYALRDGDKSLFMPLDANGNSKGYMFVHCLSAEVADKAVAKLNGTAFDKKHTLLVNHFADIERASTVTDVYKEPPAKEYQPSTDLRKWLRDPRCLDQYAVKAGSRVGILWNGREEPIVDMARDNWTEHSFEWSPLGSYLTTIHKHGIAIYGGEKWDEIAKFRHQNVKFFDWSPRENYLITVLPDDTKSDDADKQIIVWDVRSARPLRTFAIEDKRHTFKWSHDDKYLARISGGAAGGEISVYELPKLNMLDQKSLKIPGVMEFAWSPADNYLAYWLPEQGDNPARVVIMSIPDRKEIAVRNLVNVSLCVMYWHPQGDYLAVKVDRYTKSKKNVFTNFEFFRIREKGIPVDNIETKDPVSTFSWEPYGSQFAMIHGEAPKISISFYQLEEAAKGGKVVCKKTFDKKTANSIFWSPKGQFVVLAGLGSSGTVEFYDTSDMTMMNAGEHFMCSNISWDPTGRYVVSSVSYFYSQMENGYFIWTLTGRQILRKPTERMFMFAWRPRPPTLLSADDLKRIKKDLKSKYSSRFEREDAHQMNKASKAVQEKREKLMQEYAQFKEEALRQFEAERTEREALRDGCPSELEYVEELEILEETLISEKVEAVQK